MRTIATIACKGGPGKTTVATHLAIGAFLRGRKTLLADTDPQGSSSEILAARVGDGPEVRKCAAANLLSLKMSAVQARFDAMIIDTPAAAEEELGHALALADLSLLILRPTFLDLTAAVRTVDVIRRLRRPAMIIINQAPVARGGIEPPAVVRALKALGFMRLPAAPVLLRSRQAYQTALANGRSVEELSTEPAAAAEVAELWAFVDRFVFGAQSPEASPPRLRALG